MPDHLSGASRLYPIIGDPVHYVQSPIWLTRTFAERGHNGLCVPLEVDADGLDAVMNGLAAAANVDGILVTMPHKNTAFAHALLDAGVAELALHDADPARVEALSQRLQDVSGGRLREGSADPTGYDLVLNATPLGLNEGDPAPLDTSLLTEHMHVADVIAGHGTTPLIAAAREIGCTTADGADMVEAVQELMADFMLGS